MKPFDPTQELPAGTTLIEASAGTGKTWTITALVLRLLLEEGLTIEQILVVTFTEAATAELQDRVRSRLREALLRLDRDEETKDPVLEHLAEKFPGGEPRDGAIRALRIAINDFDRAAISTIHGFCRRMLQENAFESGAPFDTKLVGDQTDLLWELVLDFWAARMETAHPALVAYLSAKKFGPSRLLDLAEKLASDPDVQVIPALDDAPPPPDDEALIEAFLAFRTAWQSGGESLLDHIVDHRLQPAWKFRKDTLRERSGQIDEFVVPSRPTAAPPWGMDELRRPSLASETGQTVDDHPMFQALEAFYDAWFAHEETLASSILELQQGFREYLRKALPERKARSQTWSFDDLLLELHKALAHPTNGPRIATAIRLRHKAALIDEFQDTDPIQYEIFSRVFHEGTGWLFLIGDPKQAIYGFRGADIFAYRRARNDAGERAYTLTTNYRSDPGLLTALNAFFGQARAPFGYPFITYQDVDHAPDAEEHLVDAGPPLELRWLEHEACGANPTKKKRLSKYDRGDALEKLIAADIGRLLASEAQLDGRPVRPSDIAVLVRKNTQAEAVQARLRLAGIPSVLHGAASVLDSAEASELERFMAGVAEPARTTLMRTALATDLLGVNGVTLAGFDRDESPERDAWVERFRAWRELWERQSFARMFRTVLEEQGVQARLLSYGDGERRMTNLLHLVELIQTAAVREQLGVTGLLRWMRAARSDATPDPTALSLRLESDDRAVQLITMHRSKGLEFPIVFAPYLGSTWMRSAAQLPILDFHDRTKDQAPRVLDLGSADKETNVRAWQAEQRAEDLRLLYVAFTRAKHKLLVYGGPFRDVETSPLAHLAFQPPVLPDSVHALDQTQAHVKALGHADVTQAALSLGTRTSVAVRIATRPDLNIAHHQPERGDEVPLTHRALTRPVDGTWRTSSFSGLKGDGHGQALGPTAEGRDHDTVTPTGTESDTGTPIQLGEFPRGAKAGNFFHAVLEDLDFAQPVDRDLVRKTLSLHGYGEEWTDAVSDALQRMLDAPFHDDGLRLRDLTMAQRLNEMQFTLPVAHGLRACDPDDRVQPHELAKVFRDHASDKVPPGYADSLAELEFTPLHGFLTGFIDLIFVQDGRYTVVDYKSNYVGDHVEDYTEAGLTAAMAHGHYFLQYHLYTLALHRMLKLRLPDYDYETHIAGSTYLFLKGMDPDLGASHGAFRDRPPLPLIEALDTLLRRGR
ncbi:MAG: exodeoxyribonuclease V subunit beta [Proteobacteria bacterium]|nr:exodeoxyribonuclease V subunit beta [Pseudomonadota bacterium]MCP4921451.1 exodeoxyribonuclease V subunit beta [Pseudomonadota bacterium]